MIVNIKIMLSLRTFHYTSRMFSSSSTLKYVRYYDYTKFPAETKTLIQQIKTLDERLYELEHEMKMMKRKNEFLQEYINNEQNTK